MVGGLLANLTNELFTFIGRYCDTAEELAAPEYQMPSDVSFEVVSVAAEKPARRLPLGVGLTVGACASVALWGAIGFGLRALFF
jgi:hypothetical protein